MPTAQSDAPAPSVADPGALGLAGFAMTTFVLSTFNAGLLSESLEQVVLPLALFYGGLAQLLAGMWEFRRGNAFAATAFSSFGAFWLAFAYYVAKVAPQLGPDAYKATGLFLLAWTIFTAYMTVAALRTNGAVLGVFVTLTITFLLLTIGAFAESTGIDKVGGWFGLITAVVAWYASFATVTNATWKREVIPTWPRA
ncbi:acetate uptake transporter [Streptomyces odontomachi]|uniref:acetate uptake transporter n=1 Tax=Streptomyces odontomachi TaxID=2944940 RepID=UPI00210CC977|nr:acetate uptake transporter [Streptomyces sp. ODS25]